MKKLDKKNIIRLIAVIVLLCVAVGITIFCVPLVKSLTTDAGRIAFQNRVAEFGPLGWLLFLILQILQVVIAIIPGEPVEIIGGVLFGTFGGMALCLSGLFLGTVLVYYLVKAIGTPLVYAFVSEEKINSLKFLRDTKKLEALIFVLFLIPGTPKDTLTYFVPLTKVKPWKFFLLSTVARIPSVVSSTLAGENIGNGNWFFTILIFGITAAIGLVGIYYNEKLMNKVKSRHEKRKEK